MAGMFDDIPTTPGSGGMFDDIPSAGEHEPADHGLSERQKLSPLGKAMSPLTSYPETYSRMRKEATDQMARGFGQVLHPDSLTDPNAHGLSDIAKGIGNVAMGGIGYVSSPVNAAYRSIIGQPVEDVTGIPREYTDFAAQIATPGIGLTRMPKAPGAVAEAAPRVLPPHADAVEAAKRGEEFGIKYSLGQATGDLDRIRYEDMAARNAFGKDVQDRAAPFFNEQFEGVQEGARRVGSKFGQHDDTGDAASTVGAQVADRAAVAQRERDAAVRLAEQEALARRQQVEHQGRAITEDISGGRPPVEPREAGEAVNQDVREAAAANRADFRARYDEFGNLPGEFSVDAVRGIGNRIQNDLTFRDQPVYVDEGTPVSSRAITALDQMSMPRITNRADPRAPPDPQEITAVTLRGVDQMRKRLVGFYQQARANPSDARAMRAIIDGFDNQIERAITENLFSGDPRAMEVLQQARASYARYRQTFHPNGAGDDVGLAMRRIVDRNATPEETANMIIGSGKIGNAGLPVRIADRLEQVLGAGSDSWRSIRQAMWQKASQIRNSTGEIDPIRSAASIESFANSTLGRRMFPQEITAMRQHAQGVRDLDRILDALPSTRAAETARASYTDMFGGEQLAGSQRGVFQRMVEGTATPEEIANTMFRVIGNGNSGNTVRAIQAVERIVGRDSPAFTAIREGVWKKLTERPAGVDPKGQQLLVKDISQFLNGEGRTVAGMLYSPEELAMMRRYTEAVRQTIIPKYARTNSDTAPAMAAVARKLSGSIGKLLGIGHGLAGHAVGAMVDKGIDKVAALRQTKRLNESFGDVTATTPNPLARRPRKQAITVRTLAANPSPPYSRSGDDSNPYAQ